MVYFTMALALFAEDDYEEVATRLTETLAAWGCWDDAWSVPTSGGITRARQRLGDEPLRALFGRVAAPVAGPLTRGAFLGEWRLMAVDGFEWDVPDTKANAAEFGYAGSGEGRSAFPKVRVVSISECASHAMVDAEIGTVSGGGSGSSPSLRDCTRDCPRTGCWSLIVTSTAGRAGRLRAQGCGRVSPSSQRMTVERSTPTASARRS
jgi:hypothetical protein